MKYEREFSPTQNVNRALSKDSVHKKISGVCAGIAEYYDLPRIVIRIGTIGALITFPIVTGVAYVVASILLPENK